MRIVIPSLGRPNTQPSLDILLKAGLDVTLVVQPHEKQSYFYHSCQIAVLPENIKGIAKTRQWIVDNLTPEDNKVLMVDDDFVFFKRGGVDWHLQLNNPQDNKDWVKLLEEFLDHYSMVGISMRQGNNRIETASKENTAINGVMGFRVDHLKACGARFDDVELMEDKHVGLTLLEHGYPNCLVAQYAYNQASSNSAGGCSTFRTPELQNAAAERLRELHPKFVKVVEKHTVSSWWKGSRKDVIIQWKKAYASFKSKDSHA